MSTQTYPAGFITPPAAAGSATKSVAVGANHIVYSEDGITWTEGTPAVSNTMNDVTFGGGTWVAVGLNGKIQTSTDGNTWTERTSGTSNQLWKVRHNGSQFVAVGVSDTCLYSSDGTSWSTGNNTGNGKAMFGLFWDGTNWNCGQGASGGQWQTTNPATTSWTNRGTGGAENYGGSYDGTNSVWAFIDNAEIITSSDNGTSYSSSSIGTALADFDLASDGNGHWISAGDNNEVNYATSITTAAQLRSGGNWNSNTITTDANWISQQTRSVFYNPDLSLWMVCGASGGIATSSNGTTWTTRSVPGSGGLNGIY